MKAVILHGSIGHPFENWFPWLGRKLVEELAWQVRAPQFPTPEGQDRDNWLRCLEAQAGDFIDEDTVLIGHSCGVLLMLNYLQKHSISLAGSFFISPPFGKSNIEEFSGLDTTFLEVDFDWDHIKKNAGSMMIFHGDNDPYVPNEQARDLAEKLDCELVMIEGGGHLNSRSGYDEFPQLYSSLRKIS